MATEEIVQLRRELEQVRRELAFVHGQLRVLLDDEPAVNGRYPKAPKTTMYDLEAWVIGFMHETLERRATNTRRWCPEWYKHPEVVTRFRILYDAYREIEGNMDAISYSMWFLDHLDRHLDAVFSEDGPFASCSPDRHSPHRGLKISPNPNADKDWGERPAPPTAPTPPSPTNSAPAIHS